MLYVIMIILAWVIAELVRLEEEKKSLERRIARLEKERIGRKYDGYE